MGNPQISTILICTEITTLNRRHDILSYSSSGVSEIYAPGEISYGVGPRDQKANKGPTVLHLHTQSRVNPSGLDRRRDRVFVVAITAKLPCG